MKNSENQYLQNDRIYLISNKAVARNPIFCSTEIQLFFKKKMEYYLSPLCKVMGYSLKDHEFRLLVKLNDRNAFEKYFMDEKHREGIDAGIPESTYIFSQAMSNMQVSLVKRINKLYNRSGTLMAGRYKRREINNTEELWQLLKELNHGDGHHSYASVWVNDLMSGCKAMTSSWIYNSERVIGGLYQKIEETDLVGLLRANLKSEIILPNSIHHRRMLAAICKYLE